MIWFKLNIFFDSDTASSSPDATPSETLEDPYEETIPDPEGTDTTTSGSSQDSEPAPSPSPKMVPDYTFNDVGVAEDVIGIRDPEIYHGATDNLSTGSRVNLTTAVFDTTSRADSARIWLKNELGYSVYVRGVSIRGKLVYKNSPPKSGFVHDQYKDHDSIRESGEKRFTIKNDYIANWDQTRKLADYYWKFFGGADQTGAKHIYTLRLHGVYAWFEVGNRYRVTIGGAGQAENIDSHCELQSVSTVINAKGIGKTTLVLRQMELLWSDTSSANLRSFAYGRRSQYSTNNGTVLVAPSTAFVTADYYCDGTADDVQIQLAIDYLSTTFGGGTVNLLSGTYNIASNLTLRSGVVIKGQGMENTILKVASRDQAIASSSTIDAGISDLTIDASYTRGSPPSDNTWTFTSSSDTRLIIERVTMKNANGGFMEVAGGTEPRVSHCVFVDAQRALVNESAGGGYTATWPGSYLAVTNCTSFLIDNNEFYSTSAPTTLNTDGQGYNVIYCVASTGGRIKDNFIHDMQWSMSGSQNNVQIIWVQGYPKFTATFENELNDIGTSIEGNTIIDCMNVYAYLFSIYVEGNDFKISDNTLTNLFQGVSGTDVGTAASVKITYDDNQITGNTLTNCSNGFLTENTADRTFFSGNKTIKIGQLVSNSNCETTTAPTIDGVADTSSNVTYARDSAQKHTGSYSYKMTSTGSGTVYAYLHDNGGSTSELRNLNVGRTYTIEAWVYIPSGVGITGTNFGITFQDYQGGWGWTTGGATNTYGSWQFVSVTRMIRASATAVNIYFAWSASGAGEYLYLDDIRAYPNNNFNDHSFQLKDSGSDTVY